jgi:hypothetical protein
MNEEQKAQMVRLAVMHQIMRYLIDSEERKKRGMKWEEILANFGSANSNLRQAIDDLIALKYVVSTTESSEEEITGNVRINQLSERYGTTFFGRKWLSEQEES